MLDKEYDARMTTWILKSPVSADSLRVVIGSKGRQPKSRDQLQKKNIKQRRINIIILLR